MMGAFLTRGSAVRWPPSRRGRPHAVGLDHDRPEPHSAGHTGVHRAHGGHHNRDHHPRDAGADRSRLLGQHAGQPLGAGAGQRTGASGRGRGIATIPQPRHHSGPTARRLHQSLIDGFQCLSRVATHPAHGEPVEPLARPSKGSGRADGLQSHNFGKALPKGLSCLFGRILRLYRLDSLFICLILDCPFCRGPCASGASARELNPTLGVFAPIATGQHDLFL